MPIHGAVAILFSMLRQQVASVLVRQLLGNRVLLLGRLFSLSPDRTPRSSVVYLNCLRLLSLQIHLNFFDTVGRLNPFNACVLNIFLRISCWSQLPIAFVVEVLV